MKKKILLSTAVAFALSCTPQHAKAGSDFLDSFITAISNGAVASKICRKASFSSNTFSIRSFEGMACTVPLIAAFAESVCPQNAGDYEGSKCHTIAQRTLKGEDPNVVFASEIKKMKKSAKSSFCSQAGKISSALAVACSKSDSGSAETANAADAAVPPPPPGKGSEIPAPPPAPGSLQDQLRQQMKKMNIQRPE
ncbi:MAG: hypothetical protein JNK42_05690 [Caedimonas sp.]|jgi:hypothetical protein|nr:hypothetical protein [Caedimonas sp.]